MGSSSEATETLAREGALLQLCALLERAQLASMEEDLDAADELATSIENLIGTLAGEWSGQLSPAASAHLKRAAALIRSVLDVLRAGRNGVLKELEGARDHLRALKGYRPFAPSPGSTLDVTD